MSTPSSAGCWTEFPAMRSRPRANKSMYVDKFCVLPVWMCLNGYKFVFILFHLSINTISYRYVFVLAGSQSQYLVSTIYTKFQNLLLKARREIRNPKIQAEGFWKKRPDTSGISCRGALLAVHSLTTGQDASLLGGAGTNVFWREIMSRVPWWKIYTLHCATVIKRTIDPKKDILQNVHWLPTGE